MATKRILDAELAENRRPTRRILVWDAPVRVFHWLMVLSFAGAYLTAERDDWRLVHVTLGYTMAGLVVFRIVWGIVGTRHARFSDFVRGPASVLRYFRALFRGRPEHYIGHNPAGAMAILALLILTIFVTGSGWATYKDIAGEAMEELHEVIANVMLAVVGIHVAGVLLSSWGHRENLIGAMISGRKIGNAQDSVQSERRSVAAILLIAVLGFWWLQWSTAANTNISADNPPSTAKSQVHDHDD
jgi:cytochrome b